MWISKKKYLEMKETIQDLKNDKKFSKPYVRNIKTIWRKNQQLFILENLIQE